MYQYHVTVTVCILYKYICMYMYLTHIIKDVNLFM